LRAGGLEHHAATGLGPGTADVMVYFDARGCRKKNNVRARRDIVSIILDIDVPRVHWVGGAWLPPLRNRTRAKVEGNKVPRYTFFVCLVIRRQSDIEQSVKAAVAHVSNISNIDLVETQGAWLPVIRE